MSKKTLGSRSDICVTRSYNMFFFQPTSPGNTRSKCPNDFFVAQSQTTKQQLGLWRKTHTHSTHTLTHPACAEQVGARVPAQINIWLTLQSGYYLAEISEREVGGLAVFFILLPFFPIPAGTQVSLAVTRYLNKSTVTAPLVLGQKKCVKASRSKSMR